MVANDPHVVADGAERLDGGVVDFGLVERIVVGQRRALNGIAQIGNVEVVAVLRPHLLDIGGNAGQTAAVVAALFIAGGVIRRIDLAVQVRGYEEREIDGLVPRPGGLFRAGKRHLINIESAGIGTIAFVIRLCRRNLRNAEIDRFLVCSGSGNRYCGGQSGSLVCFIGRLNGALHLCPCGVIQRVEQRIVIGDTGIAAENCFQSEVFIVFGAELERNIRKLRGCIEIIHSIPRGCAESLVGGIFGYLMARESAGLGVGAVLFNCTYRQRNTVSNVTCSVTGHGSTVNPACQCFCFSLRRFCADCRNKQSHNQNQSQKQG